MLVLKVMPTRRRLSLPLFISARFVEMAIRLGRAVEAQVKLQSQREEATSSKLSQRLTAAVKLRKSRLVKDPARSHTRTRPSLLHLGILQWPLHETSSSRG